MQWIVRWTGDRVHVSFLMEHLLMVISGGYSDVSSEAVFLTSAITAPEQELL